MSTTQEAALAALRAGNSFANAAREAGVNRVTVYRWIQREPGFRAAYNAWQRELAESGHARLLKLTERAVEVVASALEVGDRNIAFKMLRQMGVMRPRKGGSTNEQVLKLQIDLKEMRELRRAEANMMDHVLKRMGMPPRDRRLVISGRADRGLMKSLQACMKKLPQAKAQRGEDATAGMDPGDTPQAGPIEPVPTTERKLDAEQDIPQSDVPADGVCADSTTRATQEGAPHELVA